MSMMERAAMIRKIPLEKELAFERERLLNLIDSKIRRHEMAGAREAAEELFRTEVEFALTKETKRLRIYNSLLSKLMVVLISILLGSVVFMVLNINPSFYLRIQMVALFAILSALGVNALLVGRFERALGMVVDAYETLKQSFIEKVLDSIMNSRGVYASVNLFS